MFQPKGSTFGRISQSTLQMPENPLQNFTRFCTLSTYRQLQWAGLILSLSKAVSWDTNLIMWRFYEKPIINFWYFSREKKLAAHLHHPVHDNSSSKPADFTLFEMKVGRISAVCWAIFLLNKIAVSFKGTSRIGEFYGQFVLFQDSTDCKILFGLSCSWFEHILTVNFILQKVAAVLWNIQLFSASKAWLRDITGDHSKC